MTAVEKSERIDVCGAVQGVGFRPFVYRLAHELGLLGSVANTGAGVTIVAQGPEPALTLLCQRLRDERPPASRIEAIERSALAPGHFDAFEIVSSEGDGARRALIVPDLATCQDCLAELLDPANRRYRYPFTNCTNCGPRFSIIENLPYDRCNTTMRKFAMCPECVAEYHDPANRRFHAQPNACPNCGPHLEFWDQCGTCVATEDRALQLCVDAIRDGQIVALKGIGGFQLLADARNEQTVATLRKCKHRPDKPFALLVPSLATARDLCVMSILEEKLLSSPQAPIVLLQQNALSTEEVAKSVAGDSPLQGIMFPSSPLHHLLLHALQFPVVATSANLTDEPICIDQYEATRRLENIADVYLVHDRPIARHLDDSVCRVMNDREVLLRCGRGYAPLSIASNANPHSEPTLAVGAHLKNTVALARENQIIGSQHIGDLETKEAFAAFVSATRDLPRLYDAKPGITVCDLHPDYAATRFAPQAHVRDEVICEGVQHHYAHVLSCMLDNDLEAPALGICWDGTGFGLDGTIWGGEFLLVKDRSFERVAHFRNFPLPGGEAAIKQPRRAALGLLFEAFGEEVFKDRRFRRVQQQFSLVEQGMLRRMLARKINSPQTSSAGRLFDAVASLLNLRQKATFEGQAAMDLEYAITPDRHDLYPFAVRLDGRPLVVDWEPCLNAIVDELASNSGTEQIGDIAAGFHNTLVEMMLTVATAIGEKSIVLTGGCFQNKYLAELATTRLHEKEFEVYTHHRIPPNDGGIAFGQAMSASRNRHFETAMAPALETAAIQS